MWRVGARFRSRSGELSKNMSVPSEQSSRESLDIEKLSHAMFPFQLHRNMGIWILREIYSVLEIDEVKTM